LFWHLVAVLLLVASASGCAALPDNVERPRSIAFSAPEQTQLGRMVQARRAQAGTRVDSAFKLLDSEDLAFTSRLALIDGAQRTLDLQYYAIHADASTEILLQRLRDAARRGVRVRMLLDDFNTVGTDAQVLTLAFEPNVEIRLFNPLPGSRGSFVGRLLGSLHDVPRIQKRMHNKLFMADSVVGITGGRNLGDAYFGSAEDSNFVDLDVLALGRIVRDMAASFDRYWNDELAYPAQSLLSQKDLETLRERAQVNTAAVAEATPPATPPAAVSAPAQTTTGGGASPILPDVTSMANVAVPGQPLDLSAVPLVWAPAVLLVDKPGKVAPGDEDVDAGETVIDGLLDLMQQARKDVLIVTPYFVPGAAMMAVFQEMRERGIRIRVLTNSLASNDAPAAHAGYARYRKDILALGIELHEMRADQEARPGRARGSSSGPVRSVIGSGPGGSKSGSSHASLHSKAVMIDGVLSVIGSMNLDLRSKIQNSEVALVIRSTALTRQAVAQVEQTVASVAYRVVAENGRLSWRAPAGATFPDERTEPGASTTLRLLVRVLGPFAPEEML
jgi:cardiolipin synthase C